MSLKSLICLSLLAVGCAVPMWADAGGDPSLEQDPFEGCFRSNVPVQDICRLERLLSEVTDKESADAIAPKVTAIWVELNAMTRMEPQEQERILSVCTGFREALDELAEVLSTLANEHHWYGSSLLRPAIRGRLGPIPGVPEGAIVGVFGWVQAPLRQYGRL